MSASHESTFTFPSILKSILASSNGYVAFNSCGDHFTNFKPHMASLTDHVLSVFKKPKNTKLKVKMISSPLVPLPSIQKHLPSHCSPTPSQRVFDLTGPLKTPSDCTRKALNDGMVDDALRSSSPVNASSAKDMDFLNLSPIGYPPDKKQPLRVDQWASIRCQLGESLVPDELSNAETQLSFG
ncbi:uncharacterized protein LOC107037538 isoform X2 [Diachasma alloeum]|uniref:uncharacterized protein LOC107037538 isoform X2 n=1 Tax=Diachasma alloeum TaxID=454923 RepID=UPI0007383423|nr:uncharacterized protein LOC107037538 isoform X2 [Diachasma alloeum]